ncbi:diguanylate cyclase domain-containing protein [Acinetobacter nectaris]|uniref:diguanylate cyclase domain-containing protein n=1 Tax=Acinetobacter nectaris TaxID=1219382 RepID=UPI001F25D9D7|nr:diguanylate cyclase [Acinetobacter nectaris]MCF9047301.1 diguanylate cyclase [Acinetobacter nectaris]
MKNSQITSLKHLFRKSQAFAIFAMVFICLITFVILSIFTMRTYVQQNLTLLGNTLSERIQPALVFKDDVTLKQITHEYTEGHSIRIIYIFDQNNNLLESSASNPKHFSELESLFNRWFLSDPASFKVYHQSKSIGKIQIYGSSDQALQFLLTIFLGIFICLLYMALTLWASTKLTYKFIMQSISPLTNIAQLVSNQKAYNLRFPNSPIEEFQSFNTTFNELLSEIQTWHNQLQHENKQLSLQVKHDPLTNLPNRSYFYQSLLNIFNSPYERSSSALLFIDNNNFKAINDQYGHLAGDNVLIEMSHRLKGRLRENDFIARLGGDEFAVILRSIHPKHIERVAQDLINTCDTPLIFNGHQIYFSFSIGIALSLYASSPEDLINQADQAMYRAKKDINQSSI